MTETIYSEVKAKTRDCADNGQKLSVSRVLRILGLSTSGYYDYCNRKPSAAQLNKERMMERIVEIYDESHQIYGAPKIAQLLRQEGNVISERTVGIYMKKLGIHAHYIKPYTKTTVNPDFSEKLKNILNEDFNPESPDTYWCTDITYIYTSEGFVYLSSIMDLYSRKIVAWTLSKTLEAKYVADAVKKAIKTAGTSPKILHSDRGCQYISNEYKKATSDIQRSYSKKAYPWDNACIESFHSLIKREWLNKYKIKDYEHAYRLVFEYINTFYNTQRIHSHCNYQTPIEYETLFRSKRTL